MPQGETNARQYILKNWGSSKYLYGWIVWEQDFLTRFKPHRIFHSAPRRWLDPGSCTAPLSSFRYLLTEPICRKAPEHLARNPDCAFFRAYPAGKIFACFVCHHCADYNEIAGTVFEYGWALPKTATKMGRCNLSQSHRAIS
jgi:hypothetical protein